MRQPGPEDRNLVNRRSLMKTLGVTAATAAVPLPLRSLAAQLTAPSTVPGQNRRAGQGDPSIRQIYLNQVGYLPRQPKTATVVLDRNHLPPESSTASPFMVRVANTSEVVFKGTLSQAASDAASGDHICQADFSAVQAPGKYQVEAMGHTGDIFSIGPAVYADALRLTMRAFYGQRCGCKVDLGDGYKHASCHANGGFDATSGKTGPMPNTGGWHDAGDYGRYVVNSGITCGTLLWAWELYPAALRNLHLALPESGGPVPDFLAEVRWNLHWMLSMQDPADGGVWHKQTSLRFCGFVLPEDDPLPSQIIGTGTAPYKSTAATADLAAVMAIAARCYAPYDQPFAARCLAAARSAYAWARQHPNVTFTNPPTVTTGEYGDHDCADELLWASAELFRTTHEQAFEASFLDQVRPLLPQLTVQAPSWGNVASMGLWSYAFATAAKPTAATAAILQSTHAAADALVQRSRDQGYGHTLSEHDYGWGSNSTAANQSLLLLVADRLQPRPEVQSAALLNLHYLLGRNCFGVSWVTHVGVRPFLHPHHRPSAADAVAAPWPGLLSGGPNARGGDQVADRLPQEAPMRMWVDDERAYSLNEIAINWNAPLVFLLAAANAGS